MKIQGSVTGMESERSFSAVNYSARSLKKTMVYDAGIPDDASAGGSSFLDTLFAKYPESGKEEKEDITEETEETSKPTVGDLMSDMKAGRVSSDIIRGVPSSRTDAYVDKLSVLYIFSILFEDYRERIKKMMAGVSDEYDQTGNDLYLRKMNSADPASAGFIRISLVEENYYREKEETSFAAEGKVKCADGREIDYKINVGMSREFEALTQRKLKADTFTCTDPLVINLSENITSLSDRYFYFDLDGNGEKEYIKELSGNSGYIALDKNGDGMVNDGKELFGTKTGNGFAELSVYDDDGDGWIDEDDDIFDKLRVWIRDENGVDKLLTFKEAGVGAINLMNSPTEFSLKDMMNRTEAVIRNTGMFLYEDGSAGTMQQVDLVS